jgi:hypothetical protein
MSTWKDVQHYESLGKCTSKSQDTIHLIKNPCTCTSEIWITKSISNNMDKLEHS